MKAYTKGIFYHATSSSKVRRILREGLLPKKSLSPGEEQLFVYLWDDVDSAVQDLPRVALVQPEKEPVILQVKIPNSWARLDDRYYPEVDPEYGHSWKIARRIPASRISLWKPLDKELRRFAQHPTDSLRVFP